MAYIYNISFDIQADQMSEIKIGGSLERVLGYLRTLLPGEQGYITSRALFSINEGSLRHIIFLSEWQTWEDISKHKQSNLIEDKILNEFSPHIQWENLKIQLFAEID